ncbi:MAG: type II toxin-antitoxin system HicA family toxin [Acidobacteriota bacterium]
MKGKHLKTLVAIFHDPVRANIAWDDIERMLVSLGAELSEGRGSRVRIVLGDLRAVFHRPHPAKETDRGAIKSMRRFLEAAGAKPSDQAE